MNINKELLHELLHELGCAALEDYYMYGDGDETHCLLLAIKRGVIDHRPCTQEDIDFYQDDVEDRMDGVEVGDYIYVVHDIKEMVKQIESKAEASKENEKSIL